MKLKSMTLRPRYMVCGYSMGISTCVWCQISTTVSRFVIFRFTKVTFLHLDRLDPGQSQGNILVYAETR